MAVGSAQAVINSFDGSSLKDDLKNGLPIVMFGICSGFAVHLLYKERRWENRHPIQLIPTAGWISVLFGMLIVLVNQFDLVIAINQICARDTPRPPYSCGVISDVFLKSMGGMLIWCIFYFLIQADRKADIKQNPSAIHIGQALFTLVLLNHVGIFFSVIAYIDWGTTRYLFSNAYIFDSLMNLIPILTASYVLFVSPEMRIFGSRILPLIPLLIVMAFCCASFNIEIAGAVARIKSVGFDADLYYIFFGSNYGGFSGSGQLAGVLAGGVINSLSMTLFFLCCYGSSGRRGDTDRANSAGFREIAEVWGYSFLFWLVFGILIYGIDLMDLSHLGPSVAFTSTIVFIALGLCLGVLLRLQVVYFIDRSASGLYLTITMTIASVFAGLLLTYPVWMVNYIYILVALDGHEIARYTNFVNNRNYVISGLLSSVVLCGLWSFICFMVKSLERHRDSVSRQIQLERNMKDLQLNALAGRVDPHFIFNALNNIRALVDEDGEKARTAISALSDILRGPITSTSQDRITVAEEMLLVRNYVSLSKIQYEERLSYKEECDDDVYFALIPSMMLQILVENAIKHGISQLVGGGELVLEIRKVGQKLICLVKNQGILNPESRVNGFGVGTRTIYERLFLLYGNQASFRLYEVDSYVVAEVILPFETCAYGAAL